MDLETKSTLNLGYMLYMKEKSRHLSDEPSKYACWNLGAGEMAPLYKKCRMVLFSRILWPCFVNMSVFSCAGMFAALW